MNKSSAILHHIFMLGTVQIHFNLNSQYYDENGILKALLEGEFLKRVFTQLIKITDLQVNDKGIKKN